MRFTSDGGRVTLRSPTIRFGARRAEVLAVSGDRTVRFFDLDLRHAAPPGRSANPLRIKHVEATLAGPAARLLSQELGVRFFAGDPAGALNLKPLGADQPKEEG